MNLYIPLDLFCPSFIRSKGNKLFYDGDTCRLNNIAISFIVNKEPLNARLNEIEQYILKDFDKVIYTFESLSFQLHKTYFILISEILKQNGSFFIKYEIN
jgi:hypothetical protein